MFIFRSQIYSLMLFTITSEDLIVQVKENGMELSSIKSRKTGQEYLWQGDPEIWAGQAPILFPIIGALKDGKTQIDGQEYSLPKHGFIRNSNLGKLIKQEADFLVFRVESNEETLAVYPFDFIFELTYSLTDNYLEVSHHVINKGSKDLYYSVGGHPAFACPILPDESLEDYKIEFPIEETDSTWMINPEGLIGGQGDLVLNNSKEIPLSNTLFDKDALIFKNLKSKSVFLSHKTNGPIVRLDFDQFDYLGIWAKPGAPFVCLEPWLGIADSENTNGNFAEKEGIRVLPPEKSEIKSYFIRVLVD